jgi:hypothetical protein
MARFGFVGGSYTSQSKIADCQAVMNWYPETIESGVGNSSMALYPTPGLTLFAQIAGPIRGELAINGRMFAVGGGNLYEIVQAAGASYQNVILNRNLNAVTAQLPASAKWPASIQVGQQVQVAGATDDIGGAPDPTFDGLFYVTSNTGTELTWENAGSTVGAQGGASLTNVRLIGAVGNDFQPVSMASNGSAGNQLAICSAGSVYIFNLSGANPTGAGAIIPPNTLGEAIGGIQGAPSKIVFCDGYFVVTLAGTNKFQVSALEDGTTWNPLSVQQVSVFPENISGICQAFRQLWIFGEDGHSQVYYNSGANAYTPFDVIAGAYMEEGIDAPDSLCVLDNAPFWIGGNANGAGIAWRANGYAPIRVSNHAIETAWAKYPKGSSDAVGWSYKDQGHTFWVLRFPSANNGFGATWVYDVATQMWHERGYWNQQGPTGYGAHLAGCHVFAFGQHLVGDWSSGNIYSMSIGAYSDNGNPIRRYRRAPHVSTEQQRIFHYLMQIELEVGDGPIPPLMDAAGNPRDPQIMLRWSDDGGQAWSNEHWIGAGQAGTFKTRALWNRLGYARDRVYEVAVTDDIPWRIIDAYLRASPGFGPSERLVKQAAKQA